MYEPIGLSEVPVGRQLPLGGCPVQGRCERSVATVGQLKQADYGAK